MPKSLDSDRNIMYDPLKYPPDLDLAQLHSECTQPGDDYPEGRICPCCKTQEKRPIKNWWSRNIRKDFTKYGGAVVTYFSLLKFYAVSTLIIFMIYGGFQTVVTRQACDIERDSDIPNKLCVDPMGLWVVSTEDLIQLLRDQGSDDKATILLYLRGVAFVILTVLNFGSLYLVSSRRFHQKMKEQPGLHHFALFFKNLDKSWKEEDLRKEIMDVSPDIEIREIVFLTKAQQYKKYYDQKVSSYFKLQSQTLKPKQINKAWQKLKQSIKKLHQKEHDLETSTGRAIVTFAEIKDVKFVKKSFKLSCTQLIFAKSGFCGTNHMYVDPMPKPDQIFWNYIGKQSHQKFQLKIITFFIMIGLLAVSYAILDGGLRLADIDDKSRIPATQKIKSTLMSLAVVALALCFRAAMNVLSEMRHPNTQTSKTMFIVCTTVLYHFLYFLIIPSIFFFNASHEQKNLKLFSISYQAINFLVVQLVLAGFDIFYCCWASSRKKLLNNNDPGLSQEQLHKAVTAPRFPMQFKLIILFKTWSFVIFYAFEAPLILFFIFVTLIFLLVNDRKNLYTHYRMQMIDYHVQRLFLTIYTNFFVVYMCFIFLLTQKITIEAPLVIAVSAIAMIAQIIFTVRDKEEKHIDESVTFDEIVETEGTYGKRYDKFLRELKNSELDSKIEEFVEKIGKKESLLGTQASLNQRLLQQ